MVSIQQIYGVYTADIQVVECRYTGCSMPDLAQNHEILSESGPYGSVWAHIQPESIPQGLGSLWDTSRALKPREKIKIVGFQGLGEIPPISPY